MAGEGRGKPDAPSPARRPRLNPPDYLLRKIVPEGRHASPAETGFQKRRGELVFPHETLCPLGCLGVVPDLPEPAAVGGEQHARSENEWEDTGSRNCGADYAGDGCRHLPAARGERDRRVSLGPGEHAGGKGET